MMVKNLKRIKSYIVLAAGIFSIIYLAGCEQKSEQPGEEQISADSSAVTEQPADTATQDTSNDMAADQPSVIELEGRWTGSFADHSATLSIDKQNGTEFSGTLNVEFREPMFKYISGNVNMDAMTFTMRDTRQTRDMGTYSGKITDDGRMSGTFTLQVDGTKMNFNLSKR